MLARTSNPDAGTLQHALVGERSVAQVVVDTVRGWNTPGWVVGDPLPDVGAVRDLASRFGADDRLVRRRRRRHPAGTWTSTSTGSAGRSSRPGLGAQGGSVADLRRLFGTDRAVVPTVSRDVLAAGPDAGALRAAADRWTGGARRVRRMSPLAAVGVSAGSSSRQASSGGVARRPA